MSLTCKKCGKDYFANTYDLAMHMGLAHSAETVAAYHEAQYESILTERVAPICDDCEKAYVGPVYYSIDKEACHHLDADPPCTGSLCPECADGLLPDYLNDPRRPK